MRRRPKAEAQPDTPRRTIVLSPTAWQSALAQELIAIGVGHDEAGIVARRVLQRLTSHGLKGSDSPEPDPIYYAR